MQKSKVHFRGFYIVYILYTVFMLFRISELATSNYDTTGDYLFSYYWLNPMFCGIVTPNFLLKYLYIVITIQMFSYLKHQIKGWFKYVFQMSVVSYIVICFTSFIFELILLKKVDTQVVNIMLLIRSLVSFICYQVYFIFIAYCSLVIYILVSKFLKNEYIIITISLIIQYVQCSSYFLRKNYILSRFLPNLISREVILYAYNPHDISNWAYNEFAFRYANCSLIIDYKNKIIGISPCISACIVAVYLSVTIFLIYLWQKKRGFNEI